MERLKGDERFWVLFAHLNGPDASVLSAVKERFGVEVVKSYEGKGCGAYLLELTVLQRALRGRP
jgi:hypothetical protein